MQKIVEAIIYDLDPQFSMHDFRIVRGAKQTRLIFDIAVPYSMREKHKEIKQQIEKALLEKGKQYITIIRFDEKA